MKKAFGLVLPVIAVGFAVAVAVAFLSPGLRVAMHYTFDADISPGFALVVWAIYLAIVAIVIPAMGLLLRKFFKKLEQWGL